MIASIRSQSADLQRQVRENKSQRVQAAAIAHALSKLARKRELPAEISQVVGRIDSLTLRQRQVFEKILEGQPNKVIAFDLGVSQKTVETHRARIMRKLGAGSLAELVRMSMRGLGFDLGALRNHRSATEPSAGRDE